MTKTPSCLLLGCIMRVFFWLLYLMLKVDAPCVFAAVPHSARKLTPPTVVLMLLMLLAWCCYSMVPFFPFH
jgi:hypothetical protein